MRKHCERVGLMKNYLTPPRKRKNQGEGERPSGTTLFSKRENKYWQGIPKFVEDTFPQTTCIYKIFNKYTVKISYSCSKNISSIISGQNKKITEKPSPVERECNCRNREQCPLENKCLTKNIVYEAKITSHPDETVKDYRGLCSTTFKDRLYVHNQHCNHREHMNKCELAKYVWQLKDSDKTYDISWKILKKVNGRLIGGSCRLCTTEKLLIIEHPDRDKLLNTHCIQKCIHGNKYMLDSMKGK